RGAGLRPDRPGGDERARRVDRPLAAGAAGRPERGARPARLGGGEARVSLPSLSVRRPVATSMAAVAAVLCVRLARRGVPLGLLPDLSYPAITVEVPFAGASPQEVESLLVRPIEDAVAVSQGLVRLRSSCQGGLGRVALEFRWGTPMDLAALEVREKLQQVELP